MKRSKAKTGDRGTASAQAAGQAKARPGDVAEASTLVKKPVPKREAIGRALPQIRFSAQHWWQADKYRQKRSETGLTIEEEKAAMWYEAARRRPEVQQARLEGKFLFGANGWQNFTGWVVNNLPKPWPKLDVITKQGIIEASYGPWSIPPQGYSTFPETVRAEQQNAAMQILRLPESSDAEAAQGFVEHARRFVDAGFIIVAVDKKQNQALRFAFEAIKTLPPTFRKADLKHVISHRFPPDTTDEERRQLEEKERQGTLRQEDFDKLWQKHLKPINNLHAQWHQIAQVEDHVLHKRTRIGRTPGERLIEEKPFNFTDICRQLEDFDSGRHSDFVSRVRL